MSDIERFRKHRDNQMEEARKQKEQIDYLRSDEYRNKCKAEADEFFKPVTDHVEFLEKRIKELEFELEEERQENASLRSGDDYERGAE